MTGSDEPRHAPAAGTAAGLDSLSGWFSGEAGRYVLGWEQARFDAAVDDVFGFHALQVGLPEIDFLANSRIAHRFVAGVEPGAGLLAEPWQLPVATHSVDLVVLPHVLEFSAQPHMILREAERVLVPEGQLVITGFNPLSLWGARRIVSARSGMPPYNGRFLSLFRIKDWLTLLGFEPAGGQFGCFAPPFRSTAWLERFGFMERAGDRWWPIAGAVYQLRAIKRTPGMRLVGLARRDRRAPAKSLAPAVSRGVSRGANRVSEGDGARDAAWPRNGTTG